MSFYSALHLCVVWWTMDLLLINHIQQKWWDSISKTELKYDCHLLAQLYFVILLAWSDEAVCHVVSCIIERSKWHGIEGRSWPTASEEVRPWNLPTTWWVSLKVDPKSVEPYNNCGPGWHLDWLQLTQGSQPSLTWIPDLLKLR